MIKKEKQRLLWIIESIHIRTVKITTIAAFLFLVFITAATAKTYSNQSGTLKLDLPTLRVESIRTELYGESRKPYKKPQYFIKIPYELTDYWKNAFLYPKWDKPKHRINYYRDAFLKAIIQPELTLSLKSENKWKKRIKKTFNYGEAASDDLQDFFDIAEKAIDSTSKKSITYKLSPREF